MINFLVCYFFVHKNVLHGLLIVESCETNAEGGIQQVHFVKWKKNTSLKSIFNQHFNESLLKLEARKIAKHSNDKIPSEKVKRT